MRERAWDFQEVGRLPAPGDNVAMATRRLETGTRISYRGSEFTVGHTVLEGHRFAVERIAEGRDLLSWGLRFGRAIRDIAPGDYACNEKILRVLRERFWISPRRGEDPEEARSQGAAGRDGLDARVRRDHSGRGRGGAAGVQQHLDDRASLRR